VRHRHHEQRRLLTHRARGSKETASVA
jgi:hypothetical protein